MNYHTLILIHIVSVILLLGIGGGSAFYKFMADRSGNLEVIVHTNRMVVLADWLFTTPAVIAQPITGFMLMNLGFGLENSWLLLSLYLYAFSIILWFMAVWLQMKMKKLSFVAKESGRELTQAYDRLVKYWIVLGVFSSIAMGMIMLLMIFKTTIV